ncbi:hypothetical protein G8B28_11365 [Enterococcus faecium]|uniref:hypothetical protein n=1 Tax=Enterococcus faecium TaxID=1352 RepID=UPI0003F6B329|nr:hypothetical protein [Enterococcus faecium]KEI54124.1 hypothetical protein P742_0101185 [Enterococcus faecium UC8668]MBE9859802.1 hypothetical protein [Enterococcus faecium]
MIKIFYVLLIGCITILSGCTATTEGQTSIPKKISLTQKQLDRADRLSGHWFYHEEDTRFDIEITSDQIKVKNKKTENKEEETIYSIYNYENENGKISIYGTTDKREFYISEVDTDTVYIGGGIADIESAWRVKAHKQTLE